MKTLLTAAALAITGTVTVQAADIFTCSALGYTMHDGPWSPTSTSPTASTWW
jgi:hypothetical protein